jgi:probable rRNA maturation factor
MIQVNFVNQTNDDCSHYEQIIAHVFQTVNGHEKDEINIIFLNSEQMTAFNKQFRQKDTTTDVLTFPSDEEEIESLGDVLINVDKVKEQAAEYGHSEDREVAFLAVHGYLHILGYDHHNEEDEQKMIEKQNSILNNAGLERQ